MKKTLSVFLLIAMLSGTVMFGCQNNAVNTPDTGTTIEETTIEVMEETTAEETTEEETTEEETTAEETTAEETTEEETTAEETTAEETTAEESTEEETTAEETTAEETTADDPATVIPTYTGKLKPRIINTVYPTKDVVIAEIDVVADGYDVDPTGERDSTAGIQKALDDLFANGGGTVFLPAGNYKVTKSITVHPYTTLHGDWCDPDLNRGYGTVISVYSPSKDSETEGLFMLGGFGGVVGLTVYYPNQSLDNILPYPFAFYVDGQSRTEYIEAANNAVKTRPFHMMTTVKNVTIINGYRGIGATCGTDEYAYKYPHEQLRLENIKGTYLHTGLKICNQSDVGAWEGIYVNNRYWLSSSESYMTKPDAAALKSYVKTNVVGIVAGDVDFGQLSNLNVDGCKIGFESVKGIRSHYSGSIYDITVTNCEQGMVFGSADDRWPLVVAKGKIDGGIYNNTGVEIKLTDVKVNGPIFGNVTLEGEEGVLSDIEIDYGRYYKKPNSYLYVASFTDNQNIGKELQTIINEAGKTGGVVYIPAGTYYINHPIVIPSGVELRGNASTGTRDQLGADSGTVIYVYYGDRAGKGIDDQALITLEGAHSGVSGIRFHYPNNRVGSNYDTTYVIRGKAEGVYVVNCSIAGAANGIDFRGCDNHYIESVTTFCYYNSYLLGGKNGVITACLQNPTVMLRTHMKDGMYYLPEIMFMTGFVDPVAKVYAEYIILDGAENELLLNTFAYGCKTFMVHRNSTGTRLLNMGADNIGGKSPMIRMESGDMVAVNLLRYNGYSIEHESGDVKMYNRTTIYDRSESAYIAKK